MRRRILAVATCLASLLHAANAWAEAEKTVERWSTGCTAGLTCSLRYEDPGPGELGAISFIRSGEHDSEVELHIPKPMRFSKTPDPGGVFKLSVDGRKVLSLPVGQLVVDDGLGEYVSTDRATVRLLLEAMKAGKILRLDYKGVAGINTSDIALDGFRGSLYFIDDVQDRRGRNDALLAIGKRVPEGPGSKDIVWLDHIPASIRDDFTGKDGACSDGFVADDLQRYNGFDISRDGLRLVLVPCSNEGAYNQGYALYRGYYGGALTRTSFPDIEDGKPSAVDTATNVDFDPVSGIMTAFAKDNGLGQCGLWTKWRITTEGSLLLLEKRAWYECDGSRSDPENFPMLWPVNEQPGEQADPPDEE
jgi:hypothetical protein